MSSKIKEYFNRFNGTTIVVALLTFVIGWQLGHYDVNLQWDKYKPQFSVRNEAPPANKADIDFKLFWDTWDLVSREYVDKKAIDPQKMYYGAIAGMVEAIGDPYTVFLPPEQQKSTKEELGGSFSGVGIQLGVNQNRNIIVQAPLPGTPAEKAGVMAGDLILKIDDKDALNLTQADAVKMIRGEKGTPVKLELYREGQSKPFEVTLTRDTIIVKSVEFTPKTTKSGKKVAYIKLSRFGERTFDEWSEAVSAALANGSEAVILDVRNNPGGFLDGAVFIGSEFVEQGNNIVLQENADGEKTPYRVNRAGKMLKQPMVVLMNKGSASASEIVSGALQDFGRAKLVGTESFGKGTIQEAQDLPGGTGIHVTTAKWLTPKERWIHNTGLTPDVKVEVTEEDAKDPLKDSQLDKALEILDSQ